MAKLNFYDKSKKAGGSSLWKFAIGAALIVAVMAFALYPRGNSPPSSPFDYRKYTENGTRIAVVEFSDFLCPYCAQASLIPGQLQAAYGDRINFVYKQFPLPSHGQLANVSAQASECARDQGAFGPYHDKLFANQQQISAANLKAWAADMGLDTAKFNACLDSGEKADKVQADLNEGIAAGVQATPTFFINGIKMEGARPIADFKQAVEAAAASAG